MFMRDLRRHKLDYSLLAFIALIFAITFVLFRHDPAILLILTCIFSLYYAVWGIWHHSRKSHLTLSIVLEYFLVAALGVVIVSTLLLA